MQVVHQRCCGLDVHKKTVVACIMITLLDGTVKKHTRSFSTMTADLLAMGDWLKAYQVTHVAMESTGVFWKPVFNLLEADVEVILINAQHMKAVPGRKTDISLHQPPEHGSILAAAKGGRGLDSHFQSPH